MAGRTGLEGRTYVAASLVPGVPAGLHPGPPGASDTQRHPPLASLVYVPVLPLALIQLSLRERFPGPYNLYSDWANVAFFWRRWRLRLP
jgi:hypothetical protein